MDKAKNKKKKELVHTPSLQTTEVVIEISYWHSLVFI